MIPLGELGSGSEITSGVEHTPEHASPRTALPATREEDSCIPISTVAAATFTKGHMQDEKRGA